MKRIGILRWAIRLALIVPLVVLAAAFAALQTPPGRTWLAGWIEAAASSPEQRIAIGAIDGLVPFDFTVRDLSVADAQGTWLTVDRAALDWSPMALLTGEFKVDALALGTVAVARQPAPAAAAPEPSEPSEPFALPSLPVAVTIERLTIDEIVLAEPVIGTPVRLTASGFARLADPSSGLQAHLDVERIDDQPGSLRLSLVYLPDEDRVSVELTVEEPAGGVIARTLGLPGAPPVHVALTGGGRLEAWQARVSARAGDDVRLDADATYEATPAGGTLEVSGDAAVGPLLDPTLRPLVADGIDLSLSATIRDDDVIDIGRVDLEALAGRVHVAGSVDLDAGTADVTFAVTAGSAEAFAALAPGVTWETLTLDGTATGPFDRPSFSAVLDGDLTVGQEPDEAPLSGQVNLTVQGEPTAPFDDPDAALHVTAEADLTALDLGPSTLQPLLAPASSLRLEGRVERDGRIALSTLTARLPVGTVEAVASAEQWGAQAELTGVATIPDLRALTPVMEVEIGGAARLDVTAQWQADDLTLDVSGPVEGVDSGDPVLNALLGDRVTLAADLAVESDGTVDLRDVTLSGALLSAAVHGAIQADAIGLGWSADLTDLTAVDPALTGSATGQGDLSGPFDALTLGGSIAFADLTVDGMAVNDARLDATVGDLGDTPSGDVRIAATLAGRPAEVTGTFALLPDGAVRLPVLSARFASLALDGVLTVTADETIEGRITGRLGSAADLEPLLGMAMLGSAAVDVRLSPRDGSQEIDATFDVTSLMIDRSVIIDTARLRARVSDAFAAPRLAAELTATGVTFNETTIETIRARADGDLEDLTLTADASSSGIALTVEAMLAMAEPQTRVTLTRFDLQGPIAIALARSATVTFAPGEIAVDELRLVTEDGQIALAGRYGPTLSLTLTIEALPLTLANLVVPELGLRGRLDGSLQLGGSRSAPNGEGELQISDLRTSATRTAGVDGLDAQIRLTWRDGRLTIDGTLTPAAGQTLTITARLPLALDSAGVPTVDPGGPIEAGVQGALDVSLFNDLLAAGADHLDGTLDIDLRFAGTLDRPTGGGRLTLRDGRYSNVADGIVLNQITATVEGSAAGLRLTDFSASTPNGGSLSAEGSLQLDPDAGMPVTVRLTMRDALLLSSDLAEVVADGALDLQGPLTGQLGLSGAVTLERVEIRVPDRLPATVTTLQVYEVNVPPRLAEREAQQTADDGVGLDVALDVEVTAPRRVFVRGRGLDVELGGALKVTGTIDAPRLDGTLTLQRGSLDLLGRRLVFDSGTITFAGSDIDPSFDFTASSRLNEGTAQVTVTGTADAPQIAFSSTPGLPEDEVMAQLLFGKATGSLSPFEAAQLAASVAEFTGVDSGIGVVDRLRRVTGLDRLAVETEDETGQAAIAAGSYLADDVYVGVEQGLRTGENQVVVEIELTPNVSLESGVGSDSSGRVGVNLQWDY